VKKYIVRLTPEEQTQLLQMISGGKAAARTLLRARILLKADGGPATPAWSDETISEALEGHATTVARVRQRFVEEGLEAALRPRPSKRQYARKLDGAAILGDTARTQRRVCGRYRRCADGLSTSPGSGSSGDLYG
jgi:Homeodomain-like domain